MPFANEDTNPDIVDQRTPSHEHEEMYSDINNSNKKETEKEDQNKENYTRTVKNQIQLRNFNSKQTKESPRLVIGIISSHYSKKSIKILRYTLSTLVNGMSSEDKKRHLILVCITETNIFHQRIIIENLKIAFGQEIENGLIELVQIPVEFYPLNLVMNPCQLSSQKFEDTLPSIISRSKKVVDNVYLMQYASTRGDWYLLLQDDTPPNISQWSQLLTQIVQRNFNNDDENEWFVIRFFHPSNKQVTQKNKLSLSSIDGKFSHSFGLLFHTISLPQMSEWLMAKYDQMPLEWLIGRYVSEVVKGKVFQGPSYFTSLPSLYFKRTKEEPLKMIADRYNIRDWEQCKRII